MLDGELPPFVGQPHCFVTRRNDGEDEQNKRKRPDYTITDETLFLSVKLAKLGYFGGDPLAVQQGRVDIVEAILAYETFEASYDNECEALNRPTT